MADNTAKTATAHLLEEDDEFEEFAKEGASISVYMHDIARLPSFPCALGGQRQNGRCLRACHACEHRIEMRIHFLVAA